MSAADLVKRTNRLYSMPAIAIRIFDMVDDPHYSAQDIGKVISQDPALTARLLKIANSALFGYQSEIDTVARLKHWARLLPIVAKSGQTA